MTKYTNADEITQNDGGNLVVYRKYRDVEVIHRKCSMQRNGGRWSVSMTTAVCFSRLPIRDDYGDGVPDGLRSNLSS